MLVYFYLHWKPLFFLFDLYLIILAFSSCLQIPFIAMYRKEECLSLLKDPEQPEDDDENQDKNEKTPTLKWHKVNFLFVG